LGAEVTGYALNPPTEENLFDILELSSEVDSVIGDIRDLKHLKEVFDRVNPELVLHMAAQPLVRTSYEQPVYTYETNVMGTVNILECIRLSKSVKSFLNVTTDKVYENKEIDKGYVETDFLDGYDPYSNSKSCSELVTHSYKKSFLSNIPVSTARAGNVIGGGDFALDRIIPDCFRAAGNKTEVVLRNPKSIRPYEHVLEPLFVYLEILKKQCEDSGKYEGYFNVGPDDCDCLTNGELVDQYGFKVKQYYLRDNVKLENGYLVITVKKEDNKTVKIDGKDRKILYSSGAVHTKDKFAVHEGKIEMRATMPEGVGTWPAFWTWPEGYLQATSPIPAREEIDIFEIYGENLQKVTGTAHALKADNTYASFIGNDLKIKKNEDLTRFNTYAVEWDEKEIKWLFNGRVYKKLSMKKVAKSSENTFKLPHFLMINVALQNKTGEDGDIKFPTEMKVDYVRVYKKK